MQCLRITVLRVLNQEDHQESNDGCACIDDELPRVRVIEDVTGQRPDHNDRDGDDEGPGAAEDFRGITREDTKGVPHPAEEIPVRFAVPLCPFIFVVGDGACDSILREKLRL